jgi:TRAP transporter TAXI family solute receptor
MKRGLVVASGVMLGAILAAACGSAPPAPVPEVSVRLATEASAGIEGDELARIYRTSLPARRVEVLEYQNDDELLAAIEAGQADLGFASGATTYFAYRRGSRQTPARASALRGMAVVQPRTVHVVKSSGLVQPRGASSIWLDPQIGSALSEPLLDLFGFAPDVTRVQLSMPEAISRIRTGALDALVCLSCSSQLESILDQRTALASIDPERLRPLSRAYPFLRVVNMPHGTHPGQPAAVQTAAIDTTLVIRRDLDEALVYELTRHLLAAVPQLAAGQVALDQTPATPLPLHPGAARYYREWELIR